MSTSITSISITSVIVTLSNGKYSASLSWEINDTPSASYQGDYDICLMDGGNEIETKTAKDATVKASVVFDKLTEDKSYSVMVRAPKDTGGRESDTEPLITDHYKGFSGLYDGKTLSLAWETETVIVQSGMCRIKGNNGYDGTYNVSPGMKKAVLDVACGSEFTVQAHSEQGNATGPKSDTLTFYSAPPFITDAEVKSGNSGTDITVKFTSEHDDIETVSVVLSMNGEKVYESKPATAVKTNSEYTVTVTVDASEPVYGGIDKCTVSCAYVNGSAKTMLYGDGSEMPLARPSVSAVDIQNGKTVMRIAYPESVAALGFELSDASIVSGNTYSVDLSAKASAIRPRFDRNGTVRRGVSSEAVSGFVPGYYVHSGSLAYWSAGYKEAEVSHTWSEELFKTPPEASIVSGALKLERGETGYTLTISNGKNLSLDDYKAFIDLIKDSKDGKNSVTPYGFYALTDVILRIAQQSFDDTPYLLCAYSPSERFSDIRPGLRLTADTALYMQQPDSKLENVEGFVSANSVGWSFALNSDGTFLEPDLFMGRMAKHMSDESRNSATKVTYAAGAADFMRSATHQPYYRVLYPASLEQSMASGDLFPSDNTVIMTSDSYGAILDACLKIAGNPASINQLDIPLMIFRGRSALSLSIPVQINGNICHVPVGCNVSQALSMYGYGCGTSIKMTRENDNRIPRPVFLEEDAQLGKLILIPGDRLEVQYANPSD